MRVPKLVAMACLVSAPLAAQDATITGRVTAQISGEPLGGANVVVSNTTFRAVTAANGTYTITIDASAVRGQQIVLTVRSISYRPATSTVTLTPGTHEQNFVLEADPFRLEEVIVTGVGEATDRRKLSFAAASVSRDQLQAVPGANPLEALQGKVAGLRLVPQSAQPGSEPAIRLRGATSISGRQDPLYIVDGVISRFGLADIAPEDVERVEVVKGAAASSLYGSNGANGVVQIFTNRGTSLADGVLRVSMRTEAGVSAMPRRMQFSKSHYFEIDEPTASCASKNATWTVDPVRGYCLTASGSKIPENNISDNPFAVNYDHWDAIVSPGPFATEYVSLGQRRGNTNFNASIQNTRNEGVIFGLGGYTRRSARINLDQELRHNVDVSLSTFYGASSNGRAAEGTGSPFFALMFAQPDNDLTACCNPDGSPFLAEVPLSGDIANDFNPLYELNTRKITEDRNRFTGSTKLRWRLRDWLSAEGTFGYDQEGVFYKDVVPNPYYLPEGGPPSKGSLEERSVTGYQYNTGATLTSVRRLANGAITNTTKLGTLYEDQRIRAIVVTAGDFAVRGVPEFSGVNQATVVPASGDTIIRSVNYFAISTFDIKDRYIVDALVRRDGSSLFGPENRWATYYRVSGAWRVTEDMRVPGIDEWRLRASYGTAGLRPNYDNQYEIVQKNPAGFDLLVLGNRFLKPARASELEIGTNLEFGNGRYTLEYSYANKETKDQIILVPLPALAAFRQGQWQNVGAVQAKTHELTFAARLINTPSSNLTLNIVGDRTRQVITDWPIANRQYGFQQMPQTFFLGKGSDLGVLYGNRWVRSIDELYDDPTKADLSDPGEEWNRDSVMVNEDGYVVRRNEYGTDDELAIKYVYCKERDGTGTCLETDNVLKIGNANPDFNLSFGLNFNYRRLAVSALLDWTQGGDLYNGTRQWAFQATRDRVQGQADKPDNAPTCGVVADPMPSCPKKPLGYYGVGFYNGLEPNDFFIEDGSYAKLKELSVNYTFARDQLRRVGLGALSELRLGFIARNLFTITNYSGLDPEVSGLEGDPFQVRMDWFQYPQFRTFTAVVEIAF
jgi:TonB-linked SusC/RagA family outer membrane protein